MWTTVACVLALGAGAGCTRSEPPPEQAAAERPDAARSDARITTAVQARLYTDDAIRGRSIDVDTTRGIVTLRGTLPDEETEQRAISLAMAVEGVGGVDDRLAVAPETQADTPTGTAGRDDEGIEPAWITTKIQAQYFISPEIKPWNIDVTTASNGVVTLRGQVDTPRDKAEAVRIARETEGVARVEDRLRVKGELTSPADITAPEESATPPDPWITAKIQAKYFLDDEVKSRDIDVDTREGTITLRGTVATDAQRRQAVALARSTDGVRSVTDNLQVRPETAPPALEAVRTLGQAARDARLTTTLQSKFFLDPQVKSLRIDVETRKGVVTLSGTVPTAAASEQAERIARETNGVERVVNRLRVSE
jgi:osmotically-inducible protein OsmY